MLARAIEWMAMQEECANQSFNIVNGDSARWADLWPRFAEYFGVRPDSPRCVCLADDLVRKEAVWRRLVERHDLVPTTLSARVLWPYADYLFAPEWDIISSVSKARRLGFHDSVDSAQMFLDLFESFRRDRIIP
jgi:hypothetical protein